MTEDEIKSIGTCFQNGEACIIFGFNPEANKSTVLSAILFSADANGIWVNWLVVSNQLYSKKEYGEKATNENF